jgi:hypothetical protein
VYIAHRPWAMAMATMRPASGMDLLRTQTRQAKNSCTVIETAGTSEMSARQANSAGRLTDSAQQRDSDPRPAWVLQDAEVAPALGQKVPGIVRREGGLEGVDEEQAVDEALDESAVVGKGQMVDVWWR